MNLSKLSFFTIKLFSLIVLLRITHYIFFYIFTGFVTYCSQIEPQISVLRRKERKVDGSGFLTSSISCIPTPSILWTYFKIYLKTCFVSNGVFPAIMWNFITTGCSMNFNTWGLIHDFILITRAPQAHRHVWTLTPTPTLFFLIFVWKISRKWLDSLPAHSYFNRYYYSKLLVHVYFSQIGILCISVLWNLPKN